MSRLMILQLWELKYNKKYYHNFSLYNLISMYYKKERNYFRPFWYTNKIYFGLLSFYVH